jgi:hypothetical protein
MLPNGMRKRFLFEAKALIMFAHRAAIQACHHELEQRKRMSEAFDNAIVDAFPPESADVIRRFNNERGERYWQFLAGNAASISNGDWSGFTDNLTFAFSQFCLDGGEDNDPVVIGDVFVVGTVESLAISIWTECWRQTTEGLAKTKLQ